MADIPTRLLGNVCKITGNLTVPIVGLPGTANSTTKFYVADKLQFMNASEDIPKCAITDDGSIKEKKIEIYKTDNADTGTSKWKVGLEEVGDDDFVIKDLVNNVDRITIDGTTGVITFNPPLPTPPPATADFGYTWAWDTTGITQYNQPALTLGNGTSDEFYQIGTTAKPVYTNVFLGAPIGSYALNQTEAPAGPIPSDQVILNGSVAPGTVQSAFLISGTQRLPVSLTIEGSYFVGGVVAPDQACVNNTFYNPSQCTAFTMRVGLVRRVYTGVPPNVFNYERIDDQDFNIPYRPGYLNDVINFSTTFNFVMDYIDTPTGLQPDYQPYFNHNACHSNASIDLRWRKLSFQFETYQNVP